jgi:hypothetical protein
MGTQRYVRSFGFPDVPTWARHLNHDLKLSDGKRPTCATFDLLAVDATPSWQQRLQRTKLTRHKKLPSRTLNIVHANEENYQITCDGSANTKSDRKGWFQWRHLNFKSQQRRATLPV